MPHGRVIFTDSDEFISPDPMYAHDIGLVGKPDYLVRVVDGSLIPVEVKSGNAPEYPYESHLLQLGAYCLLVEENYGIRPKMGILHYKNHDFEIPFDDDLEATVIDTVSSMRSDLYARDVERSHENPALCKACGVSEFCGDQQLRVQMRANLRTPRRNPRV